MEKQETTFLCDSEDLAALQQLEDGSDEDSFSATNVLNLC